MKWVLFIAVRRTKKRLVIVLELPSDELALIQWLTSDSQHLSSHHWLSLAMDLDGKSKTPFGRCFSTILDWRKALGDIITKTPRWKWYCLSKAKLILSQYYCDISKKYKKKLFECKWTGSGISSVGNSRGNRKKSTIKIWWNKSDWITRFSHEYHMIIALNEYYISKWLFRNTSLNLLTSTINLVTNGKSRWR